MFTLDSGGGAAVSPNLELRTRTLPSVMPDDPSPTSPPVTPAIVCAGAQRQRDPDIFSGTDEKDVEDWLESYERASNTNKWDDTQKLNNAMFYLSGVAKLWFRNHEADLRTWARFKTSIADVFGRPGVRKLRAEQRLRSRSQQTGETFTSYIEDIVDLCRRVNPTMAEGDKVRHIMKGISDDAFHMLLSKSPDTVSQVIELCQSFDELCRQRLLTRRPPVSDESLASVAVAPDMDSLLCQIKEFVRAEVARQLSLLSSATSPPSSLPANLRQVIQEQVCAALPSARDTPPVPTPVAFPEVTAPLSYAEALSRPPPQTFAPFPSAVPLRPAPHFVQPRYPHSSGQWRTPDNRPICFACGLPGHIARFCRRRPTSYRRSFDIEPYGSPHPSSSVPQNPGQTSSYSDHRPLVDRRSPSPRRRSLSPMRRRPSTPEREN